MSDAPYNRAYYLKNREKLMAACKKRYWEKRDEILAYWKERHKATYVPSPREVFHNMGTHHNSQGSSREYLAWKDIADMFGIRSRLVSQVICGETWREGAPL